MSEDEDQDQLTELALTLEARLDAVAADVEAAETETDLDDAEAALDAIADEIAETEFEEPDDEDEPPADEQLTDRVEEIRAAIDDARGPYASDVIERIEAATEAIESGDWTATGEAELLEPVHIFLDAVRELNEDAPAGPADDDPETVAAAVESTISVIEAQSLDPDADASVIEALLTAAEELVDGIDSAEEWSDLTVREQLDAHGFYDVLGHHKDYPPEWSALKEHEQQGNVEMVLLALEKMDSKFMQEHCLDSLRRMADQGALEAMSARAEKRDQAAIEILGKIGSDDPLEMLLDYATTDGNPQLQLVTLRALGEIGSTEATQTVADRLVNENDQIRSAAARALGLIGDPRAIEPLADLLAADEVDQVRGSAAWALNQIGTEQALSVLEPYTGDRSYLVQVEAQKATAG